MEPKTEEHLTWDQYRTLPRADGRRAMRQLVRECVGNMKAMAERLEVHKRTVEREREQDPWFAETVQLAKDEHRVGMRSPEYRKRFQERKRGRFQPEATAPAPLESTS